MPGSLNPLQSQNPNALSNFFDPPALTPLPVNPILRLVLILWTIAAFSPIAQAQLHPPPPPPGMILDQAKVMLPEATVLLSKKLRAAATERGILVYIVTVRSLEVSSSKQRERLANLSHFYRDDWLDKRVGVLFLIDDESGNAMLAASELANKDFPPLQRNILLEKPLSLANQEPLLRDKIEKTALAVIQVISKMQDDDRQTARREKFTDWTMVAFTASCLLAIIAGSWKRKKYSPSPVSPAAPAAS
ncbi:MAG: TPM domain-containing protein [Verrucomicrobiota bacterium]